MANEFDSQLGSELPDGTVVKLFVDSESLVALPKGSPHEDKGVGRDRAYEG